MVTRYEPPAAGRLRRARGARPRAPRRHAVQRRRRARSTSRSPTRLRARGWTIATAESCTGGLLAGRLTELAGSSDYVLGGLVVYANEAKVALAGVDAELIERHGAVSIEVAEALADGARSRLGADVGVGITGIAGPGRRDRGEARRARCASASRARTAARLTRSLRLPGGRFDVRDRSTTVALHLVRRLLAGDGPTRRRVSARLFVAAGAAGGGARGAGGVGWRAAAATGAAARCGAAALHVTLAFLGYRALDEIEPLGRRSCATRPRGARRRRSRSARRCGSRRGARACSPCGSRTDGSAGGAAARAWPTARREAVGFVPERRAFLPHVTVARVRRGHPPRRRGLPEPPAPTARSSRGADALSLAPRGRGPARYEAVERVGAGLSPSPRVARGSANSAALRLAARRLAELGGEGLRVVLRLVAQAPARGAEVPPAAAGWPRRRRRRRSPAARAPVEAGGDEPHGIARAEPGGELARRATGARRTSRSAGRRPPAPNLSTYIRPSASANAFVTP